MTSVLVPLIPVALHTTAIYLALIVMMRLLGRRQLGQLTVLDLMVVVILGSAVETSMVNGNTSLQAGFVSAGTLLLCNRLLALIFLRSKRLRHLLSAGPLVLVHDGHIVEENLRRAGMTQADVYEALREREESDLTNVKFAVMEADGAINVIPRAATTHHSRFRKAHPTSAPPPASSDTPPA